MSPLELQKGARLVADAGKIVHVRLNQDCTTINYVVEFLGKVFVGAGISEGAQIGATFSATICHPCEKCGKPFQFIGIERVCPSCAEKPVA